MAPHRLIRRNRLRETELPGWRWALIRRTPTVLIDYLFECLIAATAALTAAANFTGFTSDTSVIRMMPVWLATLYGVTISLAAATVVLGLATKHYGTTVAYGLRVLAIGCLVYAVSAISYVGFQRAIAPVVMSAAFGILAAWRGFILHSTYLLLAEQLRGEKGGPGVET